MTKHKIPKTTATEIRVHDNKMRVCRACDNLTLHYFLGGRIGWVCSRVVSALRKAGKTVTY